jgi:hypothetical protein
VGIPITLIDEKMKIICSILLFGLCQLAAAQNKDGISQKDIKTLAGNWEGTLVYLDYSDDETPVTMLTSLHIADLGDSLLLNFLYQEPNGKKVSDQSIMRIVDNGDKLVYDGEELFITEIRRRGVKLTIIAENESTDNGKPAEIRQTFIIGPGILNIIKEARYEGMKKYFTRNQLELKNGNKE